jgi:hypothetical protein
MTGRPGDQHLGVDRLLKHRNTHGVRASSSTGLADAQSKRQSSQFFQKLPQGIERRLIGETVLSIELGLGAGDVHMRHVHQRHV